MGKVPYICTDSDETEDTSSSVENVKKKKKLSILKYTHGNFRKKKCKLHTKSEPDDSDYRTRSRTSHGSVKSKLPGILKHRETERELLATKREVRMARVGARTARPAAPGWTAICVVAYRRAQQTVWRASSWAEPDGAPRYEDSGCVPLEIPESSTQRRGRPPASEDEEDSEPARPLRPLDRYLVGRVPRPAGAKPGRGGGVAIIVKKNISSLQAQQSSTSSTKKRRPAKRLARKKSY